VIDQSWYTLRINWLLVAVGLLPLAACGHGPQPAPPPVWRAAFDRDHPLVGRIWSVHDQAFVEPRALFQAAARARYVLLGEQHDNPDHHRLQAEVLAAMTAAGRRPAVAFEMLETPQQETVDRYRRDPAHDAAGLGAAVGWAATTWPPWPDYQPIAEVAFRHNLPIVAANLPQAEAKAIARGQASGGPAIAAPLPPDAERALTDELRASHCGQLPEAMLAPMLRAQRARDAQMAERLRGGAAGDGAVLGAVLISGAGHARLDRGVPWYLRQPAAGADATAAILSIAFVEVDRAKRDPAAYGAGAAPYDYLWFTPRAKDEGDDPCAAFHHADQEPPAPEPSTTAQTRSRS
jgi:uncharacterized iron-regulated protein